VGRVKDALVTGVGVRGRHQTADDAEGIVENFGERREAVGGARRVGDDLIRVRSSLYKIKVKLMIFWGK